MLQFFSIAQFIIFEIYNSLWNHQEKKMCFKISALQLDKLLQHEQEFLRDLNFMLTTFQSAFKIFCDSS